MKGLNFQLDQIKDKKDRRRSITSDQDQTMNQQSDKTRQNQIKKSR